MKLNDLDAVRKLGEQLEKAKGSLDFLERAKNCDPAGVPRVRINMHLEMTDVSVAMPFDDVLYKHMHNHLTKEIHTVTRLLEAKGVQL